MTVPLTGLSFPTLPPQAFPAPCSQAPGSCWHWHWAERLELRARTLEPACRGFRLTSGHSGCVTLDKSLLCASVSLAVK